jgi:hypothetical protein
MPFGTPKEIAVPQAVSELTSPSFVDRRETETFPSYWGPERRQFCDSREHLSPEAQELAQAIDAYKLQHRRRFITFEEMLHIITGLGYAKSAL